MKARAYGIWDIETLHDSIMEWEYGTNWFRRFKGDNQPPVIDFNAVLSLVNEHAPDNWHDALADWRYFSSYTPTVLNRHIAPLQVFDQGRSRESSWSSYKTGLFDRKPITESIGTIFCVGASDRMLDFATIAHTYDIKVIGVGIPSAHTEGFEEIADGYIDYRELVASTQPEQYEELSAADKESLIQAMHSLRDKTGNDWIKRVRIKPAIVEAHPTFDEKAYGFQSFSAFLDHQSSVLTSRHIPGHREPEYRLAEPYLADQAHNLDPKEQSNKKAAILYARIGAQQGLRLPKPEVMWIGIDIYASFIQDQEGFASFKELDEECLLQLRKDIPSVTMTDAKKVRQVLFKCFLFSPGTGDQIGFREDIKTLEAVEDLYFDLVIDRIANKAPQPVNFTALSLAVTGETGQAERLAYKFEDALATQ